MALVDTNGRIQVGFMPPTNPELDLLRRLHTAVLALRPHIEDDVLHRVGSGPALGGVDDVLRKIADHEQKARSG